MTTTVERSLGACHGAFGRISVLTNGHPIPLHAHPHLHMVFAVGGADRVMQIESERVRLTQANWLLIDPWRKHGDVVDECRDATTILAIYLNPDWVLGQVGRFCPAANPCRMTDALRRLVDRLARLACEETGSRGSFVEGALVEIVAEAFKVVTARPPTRVAGDFRIRRALAALGRSQHAHPDLTSLARDVGLSRSHFFEQFRNTVGIPPHMYVDGLLVERAIDLLGQSAKPIEEISWELGFAAKSSFTRFFRDRVGFPPSVLRQASNADIS